MNSFILSRIYQLAHFILRQCHLVFTSFHDKLWRKLFLFFWGLLINFWFFALKLITLHASINYFQIQLLYCCGSRMENFSFVASTLCVRWISLIIKLITLFKLLNDSLNWILLFLLCSLVSHTRFQWSGFIWLLTTTFFLCHLLFISTVIVFFTQLAPINYYTWK